MSRITRIIARIGWNMAAVNPIVGPYLIAAQRADVQYVAEVTEALNSGIVYSRETGEKLPQTLDELVPVDWSGTC